MQLKEAMERVQLFSLQRRLESNNAKKMSRSKLEYYFERLVFHESNEMKTVLFVSY